MLTETHDRVALPGYTAAHSGPRPFSVQGGRWVSIWSRLPLLNAVDVHDPNRSVAACIASPFGELLVYGTVLPWQTDVGEPPLEPRPNGWTEQYRAIPLQGEDWKRLKAAHADAHLIVAGDLNISLGGPRYYGTGQGRALLGEAMSAAGLVCATAFDCVTRGMLQHPAIDHVLLPSDLSNRAKVVAAWEGRTPAGTRLSDHSGLVVEIT